ncbi:MAG: SDR family NAD(P)-dependent oxidoreductase [Caldilineaceae bacterium]
MELRGRTFLVAGGASGLGAATARHLATLGAGVVLADLNRAAGEALAADLRSSGAQARFALTDVTDEAQVQAALDLAYGAGGQLGGAIHCAGIAAAQRTLGKQAPHPLDLFARVVQVNLVGSFNVARLAAAALAQNEPNAEGERGVIVLTASIAAWDGQIGQAAYAASKAGVAGMVLPMARDLANLGIRVMGVAPGLFDTPLLAGLPEPVRAQLGQQAPFPPRLGRPEEFAALVAHIMGNCMLNGEVIRLDGALRMPPK